MDITGKIKKIDETKTFGASGFRKREMVLTTNEQYPQPLMVEFMQDKCDLLDALKVGQDIKVHINLRGREWINPQGEAVYFNSIHGWKIEKAESSSNVPEPMKQEEFKPTDIVDDEPEDDLPF